MKRKPVLISFCLLLMAGSALGQKKIVALGSSTTFGAAATSNDSTWVGRLQAQFRKNTSPLDPDTVIYQVGGYGYTTYHVMPDGYVSPIANRPGVATGNNITTALAYHPDVVIINLPSNDVASLAQPWISPAYSKKETMDNFRYLYQLVVGTGASCFITTSQPRNDLDATQRQMQRDLVDSIRNNFGLSNINFWDDLVTQDGTNRLRDEVRHLGYSDSTFHLNNYGHQLIYEQVRAKQLFALNSPLPVHLIDFSLQQGSSPVLSWRTAGEAVGTEFGIERRSANSPFTQVAVIPGKGGSRQTDYSWAEPALPAEKTFYRLKITEPGRESFSRILEWNPKARPLAISRLNVTGNELVAEIFSETSRSCVLEIISLGGSLVTKKTIGLERNTTLRLPLGPMASGTYILSITTDKGLSAQQRFSK